MPEFDITEIDEDAVLKEVWNINEIDAKTELSDTQIESITKIKTLSELLDVPVLKTHSDKFMILQKSRNRKSMQEFVDVVRAKREDFVKQGSSFFGSMLGR